MVGGKAGALEFGVAKKCQRGLDTSKNGSGKVIDGVPSGVSLML
jgi:hypothetical protein